MEEVLDIKKTEDSPEVFMNAEKGFISVRGTSWLEDAVSFYRPLHQWLVEYFKNPRPVTEFEFCFSYINTSSAKQIAKFVSVINEYKSSSRILIKWFYEKDDGEMLKTGEKYSELLNIDFQFIETDPPKEEPEPEGFYHIF